MDEHRETGASEPADDSIERLVAALADLDGIRRQGARESLVSMGRQVIPALTEVLHRGNRGAREEAAKALAELHVPEAAPALVSALEDIDPDVRWLAADGLIALGLSGMPSLLRALIHRSNCAVLLVEAYRIVSALARQGHRTLLAPLIAALESLLPAEVQSAASRVLEALEP